MASRGRGRPRKNGEAKKGYAGAAAKRYQRAVRRWEERPEEFIWRDMLDIEAYVKHREKSGIMPKYFEKTKAKYDEIKSWWEVRNVVAKRGGVKEHMKRTHLAAKYATAILKLKNGERVEGFTIMPTKVAHRNHTLLPIVDLADNTTFCAYKDEYK